MQAVESLLDNGASTEQHQRLCYTLILDDAGSV